MVLGSISHPPQPLVSIRRGIAWGLAPRSEDSSVLVLTSPNRYYVDIRFALEGEPTAGPFWAFGGRVTYTKLPGVGEDQGVGIRGEWAHPIDSMGNTEGVDQADLFTLDNGDQIEVGLLENPATGKTDRFMEYWTKPSTTNVSTDGTDERTCTVAILEERSKLVGIAIRVGDYAQGIKQISGAESGVLTSRWTRDSGQWQKDAKGNAEEDDIPMQWLLDNRNLHDVKSEAERWNIVELVI